MADVCESDITSIRVGDVAHVMFPNGGAPTLGAKVNYIQPQVDPTTRTLKVRLDANNPGLRMKPDMFVNVEFGVVSARRLVVPAEAVDTGDRQTVFVDLGTGILEPRQVVAGGRFGDRVAITSGLSAGERVVSSGTFLIDSESQLKAAAKGMGEPTHQHGDGAAIPPSVSKTPGASPPGDRRHD
jgi:multidrug efflux pump subunit AcrA (membrane-fusion protein)